MMELFNTAKNTIFLINIACLVLGYVNKPEKKGVPTTYYYGGPNQLITAQVYGSSDNRELSLSEMGITNTGYWTTTMNTNFSTGNYLAAITFLYESTSNGGYDGSLCLQEAIDYLWEHYITNSESLPTNGSYITADGALITIHRKAAVS